MAEGWVGAYTRKSRAPGDPDDASLMENHVGRILKMAAEDGVQLRREDIITEVRSGGRLTEQSAFYGLLLEVERLPPGHGGTLYCTELSRLSRGTRMEGARIADAFERAAIRVRTPDRTYDPADAVCGLMYDLEMMFARKELAIFKARAEQTRQQMTRDGKPLTGQSPYGYRWSKIAQQLQVHEPEFSLVGKLFQEALTNSVRQLGERHGLPFSTVGWILRNPVYTGWPHRRTYLSDTGGTKRLPRDQWRLCEKPGDYPPAVSVDLFEAVQKVMDERRDTRPKCATPNGWCRDVLRLIDPYGEPHGPCNLESIGGRRVSRPTYTYRLPDRPRLYIDRPIVHNAAEGALARLCAAPGLLKEAVGDYIRSLPATPDENEESHASILSRVSRLRTSLDDLLAREVEADHPEDRASIARVRETKRRELDQLVARLQPKPKPVPIPDPDRLIDEVFRLSCRFPSAWEQTPETDRRTLVNCTLEAIDVKLEHVPGQRQWRREVTAVRYQHYLDSCLVESRAY